jgi:hypothetical protein
VVSTNGLETIRVNIMCEVNSGEQVTLPCMLYGNRVEGSMALQSSRN